MLLIIVLMFGAGLFGGNIFFGDMWFALGTALVTGILPILYIRLKKRGA